LKISNQQVLFLAGVFFVFAVICLGLTPIAQAEHECYFDQNQKLVCPEHEEEQQPDEPESSDSDRDQDGVPDDEDQCPNEPGLEDGPNGAGCPESGDAANTGEEVDIDLDEEEEPFETRNECTFDAAGIEVCLFQAFFAGDENLEVIRVIDRCSFSGNGSVCERLVEHLICALGGRNCDVNNSEQTEETCDGQGICTERVLIEGDACNPRFDLCIDLPDEAFGGRDFPPIPVFEHVVIMQTPATCRDEGSVRTCEREIFRCVSGVCTRIGRSETQSSCLTSPTGSESCRTQTSVQTCDGMGTCRTTRFIDHQMRCNPDGSICTESTSTFDCEGDTSDFSCLGGTLKLREVVSHTDSPGAMRWSNAECDPATDRCRGTDTSISTRTDGGTTETTDVFDCPRDVTEDLGFPAGEPACALEFRQDRICPSPSGPCRIENRRNLTRDSSGIVTRFIRERASKCAPETTIAEDGCSEGERSEWVCDPDGITCRKTTLRGWSRTEDSTTSWSGEDVCVLIAPLTFQCRTVERTTLFSRLLASGEVERGSIHTTCDPDTGMCDSTRSTFVCNDDQSSCRHSRRTDEGRCDAWLVNEGRCSDASSSNSATSENWERTCMPDGSCTRTGTISEYQCEMGERAGLCPGVSDTSYSATEQCPSSRADTAPENCTLLSSTATINYADGRMEVETITCMPDVPSCQIDVRTTHPDGTLETRSWACGPSASDDVAPYRNGTCRPLVEER